MEQNNTQNTEWTTKRLLEWTTDYFTKGGGDQPRLSAEILLSHILQCPRITLYTNFDYCPTPEELKQFRELVKRGYEHEPVSYLTGKAYFYSLELHVEPGVLIPRPETEILVTQAIEYLRTQTIRKTVDVLDLGTGSGCIAIALAVNTEEADITAVDISPEALEVTRKNIDTFKLTERIHLLQSDLFANMDQAEKGVFDLIVSNPPYISEPEFAKLEPVVRDYEPQQALLAGPDGLDYYRRIIAEADDYLAGDGMLMVEIAWNQADPVTALFESAGYLSDIALFRDQQNHPRVITARKK